MGNKKRPGGVVALVLPQAPGAERGYTQIGLHAVKSLYKNPEQKDLDFGEVLKRATGEAPRGEGQDPEQEVQPKAVAVFRDFGITSKGGPGLTEIEHKVMDGILKRFSELKYRGDLEPKTLEEVREEKYGNRNLPQAAYDNIDKVPVIRLTQRGLLGYAGLTPNKGTWERAVKAVDTLRSKQYLLYYNRLAKKDGGPQRGKDGKFKMETVDGVIDTLFHVKPINNPETGRFMYYEIYPSFIFLDQVEGYFLMIPWGWRKEVEGLVGIKQTKYLYLFLTWLMASFEDIRRSNEGIARKNANRRRGKLLPYPTAPYKISKKSETIAEILRMPETVYKRNRAKARAILDTCYEAAKTLGYLEGYKREGLYDTLYLKVEKYYTPGKELSQGA